MKSILAIAILVFALGSCDTPENTTGSDINSAPYGTDSTSTMTDPMDSTVMPTDTTMMPSDTTTNRPDSLR